MKFRHACGLIAALFLALPVQASTQNISIDQRFPYASIQSVEQAREALDRVAQERQKLEQVYKRTTRACYENFLVNQCLSNEKKIHDAEMHKIDVVELQANRYQRQKKHEDIEQRRHAAEAERARTAEVDAAKRAQNSATFAQRQANQKSGEDLKHPKNSATTAPHAPGSRAVDDPQTRQGNALKQAQKEKEAEQHRASLTAERTSKLAERTKKLEAKRAKEAAVKEAASVAPAAAAGAVQTPIQSSK